MGADSATMGSGGGGGGQRSRSVHLLCAGARGESGHSLVVVVFHKLLELFDVAHRLQVLLHVGQGCEVICKRWTKPEASVFPISRSRMRMWASLILALDAPWVLGHIFSLSRVADGPLGQALCWALGTEGSSGLVSALEECPQMAGR